MGAPAITPAQAPATAPANTDRTIIKAMMQDGTTKSFELPGTLDDASLAAVSSDLVRQLGGVQSIQAFTPGQLAKPEDQPAATAPFSGAPGHLADVTAAQGPESMAGFTRGAIERFIEPASRLSSLLSGGALGIPSQGPVQTGADLLAAGLNFTPVGFPLAMKGVATQGISEALGVSPHTSRLLSMAVEFGSGLVSAFMGSKAAVAGRSGAKLVKGVETAAKQARKTAATAPRLSAKEAIGLDLKNLALKEIEAAAKTHGNRLEAVETFIQAHRPKITIDDPDYDSVRQLVGSAVGEDIVSLLPGPVKNLVRKMNNAMSHTKLDPGTKKLIPDPLPIEMRDLISIRRIMGRQATAGNILDKAAKKLARGFRKGVTNIIEKGAPRNDLMAEFAAAREAYQLEVFAPRQALARILRANVTPHQAFKAIFGAGEKGFDPAISRGLHGVIGKIPGVRDKLRIGFIEGLGDFSGDIGQLQAASKQFKDSQLALGATGLFGTQELKEIGRALTSRSIPNMIQRLQGGLTRLAEKGGPGSALIVTMGFLKPEALFSVLAASSTVGLARKLMLTTVGGPTERKIAGILVSRVTTLANRLNASEHANLDIATSPDDDTMPVLGRGAQID